MSKRRRVLTSLALALSVGALVGCESLSYYSQSVRGQLGVLAGRRAISDVVADESVSATTRSRLAGVREMRRFAITELGLADNASYTTYTDLGRPHVVWNVFATQEFSVEPNQWCFPIVGCVVYRGYFREDDAKQYAEALERDGHDTYVAGINAYSTLGWFSDPVMNTFLHYSEPRLAGLIFHELTHQKIYVKGDSAFNESLATAVELEGIRRWLLAGDNTKGIAQVRQRLERSQQVTGLLLKTREALAAVYAREADDETLRNEKRAAFDAMRKDYEDLKQEWGGYDGYDAWFARDFNNAHLVSAAAYHGWLPAFEALMRNVDYDMGRFWAKAEALADMTPERRTRALEALVLQ